LVWLGETVTEDDVVLAEDEDRIAGVLVCSVDKEKRTGNILSAYVRRHQRGRQVAELLVNQALGRFQRCGLRRAVAAPGASRSMEVESPIHLALLDAGFAWENDWWPSYQQEEYGVFLGGSLEGFCLQPEIREKIERLHQQGIEIEQVKADRFCTLRRLDTGELVAGTESVADTEVKSVTFVALVDGQVVGWLPELAVWENHGRILGGCVPEVIPTYRRRGIGTALYHLGTEEVVRQGAQYGWTATGIHNPARLIYRSIGYQSWYTAFSRMSKRLR
jgi:ribosomal protein S18 acetylase RimI-like enzyme